MKVSKKRKEVNRKLSEAEMEFLQNNYKTMSLEQIGKKTRLSKQAIAYHVNKLKEHDKANAQIAEETNKLFKPFNGKELKPGEPGKPPKIEIPGNFPGGNVMDEKMGELLNEFMGLSNPGEANEYSEDRSLAKVKQDEKSGKRKRKRRSNK